MGRKAVDVVLLPDEAMTDKAIEANAELVKRYGEKIVLNKVNCLPHISLAMGCLDDKDAEAVATILKAIAEETSLTQLQVIGIQTSTNSSGEGVSVFEVAKTTELQLLHETVMQRLEAHLNCDVTAEMLYGPAQVTNPTLLWIENYREKSSFAKFFPHITIGYGRIEGGEFPIEFNASKLALCHLGNHCTCRRILASAETATQP
jgi:2'-5' RNA ligase